MLLGVAGSGHLGVGGRGGGSRLHHGKVSREAPPSVLVSPKSCFPLFTRSFSSHSALLSVSGYTCASLVHLSCELHPTLLESIVM